MASLPPSGTLPSRSTHPRWRVFGTIAIVLAVAFWWVAGRAARERARGRVVDELLAAAVAQETSGDFRGAWASTQTAAVLGVRGDEVRRARQNAAMLLLENQHPRSADPLSPALLDTLATALAPVPDDPAARRADLLAHAAWIAALRASGTPAGPPDSRIQEALSLDPQNPYAHAMMGYLLLDARGDTADAATHFAAAFEAARARDFVRRMQVAAMRGAEDPTARLEVLQIVDRMRHAKDQADAELRAAVWEVYTGAFSSSPDVTEKQLFGNVPPVAQLATFRWLFERSSYADTSDYRYPYYAARLEEAATSSARALKSYREALALVKGRDAAREREIERAIARLTGRR